MKRPRVVLADDHTIVLEGLSSLLQEECDLKAAVRDGRKLIEAVKAAQPDIIIADISMPYLNGLEAARRIKKANPRAKIIFLTMHSEPDIAGEAFRAGASGYLLKSSAGEELMTAIREVMQGRVYITPLIAKDVLQLLMETRPPGQDPSRQLTPRQREVIQLIAEGRTMKEIAAVLKVSTRTVEHHKYTMMRELGVKSTADLVRYAVKHGIVAA